MLVKGERTQMHTVIQFDWAELTVRYISSVVFVVVVRGLPRPGKGRPKETYKENRLYPWGGRQFGYSDWLIAQSCQEQKATGHQKSEEL